MAGAALDAGAVARSARAWRLALDLLLGEVGNASLVGLAWKPPSQTIFLSVIPACSNSCRRRAVGPNMVAQPATMWHMVAGYAPMSQLRRGVIEYCVLALLRDDELYAFDLVRSLAQTDGLLTTEGTLYPLLGRLRREGLVETSWRESPNGPPRRYYRLTASGHAALARFTSEWERFRTSVDELLKIGGRA
jgi:PadR family transcriptional regulator PadR